MRAFPEGMAHTDSDGDSARAFLDSLRRGDLSALLLHARVEIGVMGGDFGGWQTLVVVRAPQPFAEALSRLPEHDRKRIAEAALSKRGSHEGRPPTDIVVKQAGDPVDGPATLLPDLIIHREMMIAVATGKQQIQEVDDYYPQAIRDTRLRRTVRSSRELQVSFSRHLGTPPAAHASGRCMPRLSPP